MAALKRSFTKLLLAAVLLTGCTYHEMEPHLSNTCSVQDPLEDLPWLADMIASMQQSPSHHWFIQQGTYKGQTVFAFNICCLSCNYVVPVYNCSGVRILDNLYVQGSVTPQVLNLVTILQPDNFECTY